MALTSCVTLPLQYFAIDRLGFVGGPLAQVGSGWLLLLSTFWMTTHFRYHEKCWHGWSRRSLQVRSFNN